MQRFIAFDRVSARPAAILEAADIAAARRYAGMHKTYAATVIPADDYRDAGATLREGTKKWALLQGKDPATAERIAEASGYKSALEGLPTVVIVAEAAPAPPVVNSTTPTPKPTRPVGRPIVLDEVNCGRVGRMDERRNG